MRWREEARLIDELRSLLFVAARHQVEARRCPDLPAFSQSYNRRLSNDLWVESPSHCKEKQYAAILLTPTQTNKSVYCGVLFFTLITERRMTSSASGEAQIPIEIRTIFGRSDVNCWPRLKLYSRERVPAAKTSNFKMVAIGPNLERSEPGRRGALEFAVPAQKFAQATNKFAVPIRCHICAPTPAFAGISGSKQGSQRPRRQWSAPIN